MKLCLQKVAYRMANSEDPDQQSDLGLHCLPKSVCLKIKDHCGMSEKRFGPFTPSEDSS